MHIKYWTRNNGSADVIVFLEEIRASNPKLHDNIMTILDELEEDGLELGKNRKGMIKPLPPYKNLYELRPYGYRIYFTLRDSGKTAHLLFMTKKGSRKARKYTLETAHNRSQTIK